jgi:subtilisin family serine protease
MVTAFAMALPALGMSEEPARTPQGLSGSGVGGPVDLDQEVRLFVQLDVPSVSEFVASSSSRPSASAQKAQAAKVRAQQASKRAAIEAAGAEVVSSLVVGANGFHVNATLRSISALSAVSGVKSVARVTIFEPTNETSVPWIGAPEVWASGYDGTGVSIGIIDTGLDYYHANLGGSGDPADFAADDGLDLSDGNFPSAKVVGGYDFVGDDYNADPTSATYQPVPHPDLDPLDCQGHGSHVGGTAAGLGVPGLIGPGVAPGADLYALRVFGCDGSTDVVSEALEWAMDPNGDGSMDDHLDVINMSLGSPFGSPDDPSAIATGNAVAAGIVVVASAGNEGDAPYVTGSPAVSSNAISVAASVDCGYAALGISYNVDGGDDIEVEAAEGGFTPPLALVGPVTGEVVEIDDGTDDTNDGCEPAVNDLSGKIALIERGLCDFVVKVANAEDAGAIAVIVFNDAARGDAILNMGGSGVFTIPSVFVGHSDGQAMADAYNGGSTVEATLSSDIVIPKPELADTLADFTSRGPGFGNTFKPDLAAPGFGINSTNVGTGVAGGLNSGTSMAAPHVAGAAALLLDKNSSLSPAAVKALLMNSTTPAAGDYPLARQGTGVIHVDVAADLGSYAMPGGVTFGRIDRSKGSTATRTITVTNMTGKKQTYAISHEANTAVPGVTVASQQSSITVGAHSSASFKVKISTKPDQMAMDDNFFSQTEADGWFVLTSTSDELRVGYIAVVDPGTRVSASAGTGSVVLSNTAYTDGAAEGFGLVGKGTGSEPYSIRKLGARAHDLYGVPVIEFGFKTAKTWPTFSPYEVDIYINDDPATDCDGFGNETVVVALDLGLLLGGDPSGTVATAVYDLCTGDFPIEFYAGMDYNDRVGVLTNLYDTVFPYDGDGVFSYEAYTFDYYTSGIDFVGGSVNLGTLPSVANPIQLVEARDSFALTATGHGQMLWLFPNNRGPKQGVVFDVN